MTEEPSNPTLLLGVGDFGRAVLARVKPPSAAAPPDRFADVLPREDDLGGVDALETLLVDLRDPLDGRAAADETPPNDRVTEVVGDARDVCRRLLDLSHFVDSTEPGDARGPHLDVFVVADLGDQRAAALVPPLVEELGARLRRDFRPVLRAGQGALSVCPLLFAPRGEPAIAPAVRALAASAAHPEPDRRPHAKIYVVEDQSGKYVLRRRELERSFAAFLHLILFTDLRDASGVRELVERTAEARTGPFATFACATLEIDMEALVRLCILELARETLGFFEPGILPISEIAAEAHPLVPERVTVEDALWQEGADNRLERYLEPPQIHVPEIRRRDSPEEIADHKFGPMWTMQTDKTIASFRDEVERFKMDRLAQRIERNGTALVEKVEGDVLARIRAEIGESPRGPLRALEFARYAATRARGEMERARTEIDSPRLRRFPESPVERGVTGIREATAAKPRRDPYRMRFFGVLSTALGAALIGALVHLALIPAGGIPWWISGLAGLTLALSTFAYLLWRHDKRHHNWVVAERDELHQALQHHLQDEIVDYFRRRLEYTRLLWVYRIYRRLAERLDDLVVQLEGARAAIAEAERAIVAEQHDLYENSGSGGDRRGILYRSILEREVVDAYYDHVRPIDTSAVAERFLADVLVGADALEAPYAAPEAVVAFCARELEHTVGASPYEESDSPLYPVVTGAVRDYLEQLALKLSPPLELRGAVAATSPRADSILLVPERAEPLVRSILDGGNLAGQWNVQPLSSDLARLHLLIERDELEIDALACAGTGDGASARAPGKPIAIAERAATEEPR